MSESEFPVTFEYFKSHIDHEEAVNDIFRKATNKNDILYEEYKNCAERRASTLKKLYHKWYMEPWPLRIKLDLHIKPCPSHVREKLLAVPEHLKKNYDERKKKWEQQMKEKAQNDYGEMVVIDLTEDGSADANERLPAESNTNASIGSDIGKITKLAKKKQESKRNQLPTIENGKTNETAEFAGQIAAYIARSKNLAGKIYKLSDPDYDVKCRCVHKYICLYDFLTLTNVRKVLGKNRVDIYEWYLKFLKKDESTIMALDIRSLLVAELYKRPNLCDLCYQCIRLNIQDYANDKAREAQQDEVAAAAAATATSATTKERKSHNVTHNDVIITLDSSSDTSDASDTNQSNVMHSNTVSNIQNNITASKKSKRKSSENLNSTSSNSSKTVVTHDINVNVTSQHSTISSNDKVPVADAFQLSPIIDPEQLEFLVTDENYYNQFLVLVQKRFSVEFADLNTANLPVNFATFKKTIYHEEYVKNILLLVCANNENVANKLLQNSELYEAILKHAHFHYFTKSNFRKVCPLRLKAAPVFIKKKFTFDAETAKDNGNAANAGDSLAEAVSTASSSGNTEKTSQHRTAQAENFKILQPKKNQAAENKGNAADNGDSLPANKKSMKCASKAEKVTNQINYQPQTVQTENFQKPKRNPKKTQAIKAQAAKDKENAVDLNDSLPVSTVFSSQPQTVQASPRKAQAVNEQVPNDKNIAGDDSDNDDDDSLPLAAVKRKSTAVSSHAKKTNCQPQTLQAEHFPIPKPIVPNDKGIAGNDDDYDDDDSLPLATVKRKSTVFSSQPQTVQASPRKANDKGIAGNDDALPLAAIRRKSTAFSSQPQAVQTSSRKVQAVNEQVPNDKGTAGNDDDYDDDDSLPLAAVKRKSSAFSSHAKKTNCQPQTLQAEHSQISKPINSPKKPQAVNEQTATGNAADVDSNLVDKNISLEEAKSLKKKNRLEKKNRFEKAKRIFVSQKDKHLRFDYLLATTFGVKQKVTECMSTLGYDDFVRLAVLHDVGELQNYDKLCEELYKTVYQAMNIWPTNLYIPLEDFVQHVFFQNIVIPNDVTTLLAYISPKFMHWVDLIERTNYYECVEKYYFHRYCERIPDDDSTIINNACEEYYQICYAKDQWMLATPFIIDDYLINLLKTMLQYDGLSEHEDNAAEQLAIDVEEPTVTVPAQDVMEQNYTVALQDYSYASMPSTQQQIEMLPDEIVISDDPLDAIAVGDVMEQNNTVALQDHSYVSMPSTQQQIEMLPDEIVISDDTLDADAFGISSISADVLHIKQEPVVWLNKLEFTIKDGNSDQFLCTPVEPTIVNLDNSEENLLPILLNFDDDDGESNARYVVSDINDELENSCDTTASSTFNLAQRLPSSFECESLVNQKSQENHVPATATTTTTVSQAFLRDVNLESSGSGSSGSGIGTDEHSLKQQQHEQQQQTADSEPMLCSEQPAANITSAAMANQTVANDKDVLACNSEMNTQHEELDCATSHSTKTTTNTTGLTKVNRKRTGIFDTRVVLKKSKIIDNNANNIIEQLKAATASLPQLQPELRPLLLQQQQTLNSESNSKQTANNITEIKTKEKETTASKQLKSATTFVPQLQHGFKPLPLKKKKAKQLTDSHLQMSSSSTTGSTELMKTITITETVTTMSTTKAMLSPKILTHQPPITYNISQEMSKDNSLFNSSEMQRFLEQQNFEQQPAVAADTNSTTSATMQNQQPQDKDFFLRERKK